MKYRVFKLDIFQLKKLTDLKDQVIGFFGCLWKHYDKGKNNAKKNTIMQIQNFLNFLFIYSTLIREINSHLSNLKSALRGY